METTYRWINLNLSKLKQKDVIIKHETINANYYYRVL